jgi:hypothetical protein
LQANTLEANGPKQNQPNSDRIRLPAAVDSDIVLLKVLSPEQVHAVSAWAFLSREQF